MTVHEWPFAGVVAPTGRKTGLTLGFLTEGFLHRLLVRQASGVPVSFRVSAFRSARGFPGESSSSPSGEIENPDMLLLTGVGGAAGADETVKWEKDVGEGVPYRNMDGTLTRRKYEIYLVLDADGAYDGAATWDIVLGGYKHPARA